MAAGLVAVVAGAVFAARSFADDETGAATPEEAATRLIDAIADEDVLGVVDLLPDGERELLRDLTTSAGDEYQRLGILSSSFSLDGFPGVDITVTDLEVEVEEITAGLAQVFVTEGELTVEVDGDELVGNLGEVVEAVADARDADLEVDDVEEQAGADELEASFVVIEEDGRWHPSLAFTIAELARQSSSDDDGAPLDVPDLDAGVTPAGADSPEAALQALLDAGAALDAEAALAVLDPGEARALQVYSQFFLPVDEADDVAIEVELTGADVEGIGGGASRVVPTGFELRAEADGERAEVILDDGCLAVDVRPSPDDDEGEPFEEEFCFGGDVADALPDELGDVEVSEELQAVADAFLPLRFGIVTIERDGEHFVAPLRTLGDLAVGFTRGLERDDLEEGGAVFALLSGELDDEVEELLDQLFESAFVADDEVVFDGDIFGETGDDACEGVGCGFGDETGGRDPTGASGPGGELLASDVVEGRVGVDESETFTAVADTDGTFVIGAEGTGDFDGTIRVVDAASGEELATNDDRNGFDPEVEVDLQAGQVVEIEVAGFGGAPGAFAVYFEPI